MCLNVSEFPGERIIEILLTGLDVGQLCECDEFCQITAVFCVQCRKFKGSEAVRRQAGLLYDKFRTLFHLSADSVSSHAVFCVFFTHNTLISDAANFIA